MKRLYILIIALLISVTICDKNKLQEKVKYYVY